MATSTSTPIIVPNARPLLVVVAAALVDARARVLIAQRPEGKAFAGQWEFPGGKLHAGEAPEAALVRELQEELGIGVAVHDLAPFAFASHAYDDFHLLMPLYLCRHWQGQVVPMEGQAVQWVLPRDLGGVPMLPADVPLVTRLQETL